jgi:SAM-dependent methyltransferase
MSAFGLARAPRSPFRRIEARSEHQKLLNILNYTKTSGSSYSADRHPAGYHSIELDGRVLRGQRDPQARLAQVPIDWAGKSVLDIGSNQGGMLFALADKLKWGVGIDYDSRLVNAANRIRRSKGVRQLDFFVFNLEQEQLDLVRDLLPEDRVDVCFLLSVCMWIENWREVIDFAASVADTVLFETNGARQDEQIAYLRSVCRKVDILAERSTDDPNQQDRKLLLCTVR